MVESQYVHVVLEIRNNTSENKDERWKGENTPISAVATWVIGARGNNLKLNKLK